jgi:hypothetical protein
MDNENWSNLPTNKKGTTRGNKKNTIVSMYKYESERPAKLSLAAAASSSRSSSSSPYPIPPKKNRILQQILKFAVHRRKCVSGSHVVAGRGTRVRACVSKLIVQKGTA